MFILYNGRRTTAAQLQLPLLEDRAFQYNDGFFETAIVVGGQLRFWPEHRQRMREAAQALQLQLPHYLFSDNLKTELEQLAAQEQACTYGRVKLKVWRAGAGLYFPTTNEVNWMATAQAAMHKEGALHIGVCERVRTAYTVFSHVKGPQAPLYVQAALEKKQQDDMLLLSRTGHVAELTSSNIFWLNKKTLYTPPLSSGCVHGILRRKLAQWCQQHGYTFAEVAAEPDVLFKAEAVFAANVTGIKEILSINQKPLPQSSYFIQQLRNDLQV